MSLKTGDSAKGTKKKKQKRLLTFGGRRSACQLRFLNSYLQ